MYLEDRVTRLEELTNYLIEKMDHNRNDKWVTPKELSKIMNCSVNNIYIKIRSGEIYATDKLGSILRIPLSQFYKKEDSKTNERVKSEIEQLKEKIFG